jgi:hypothetical protein
MFKLGKLSLCIISVAATVALAILVELASGLTLARGVSLAADSMQASRRWVLKWKDGFWLSSAKRGDVSCSSEYNRELGRFNELQSQLLSAIGKESGELRAELRRCEKRMAELNIQALLAEHKLVTEDMLRYSSAGSRDRDIYMTAASAIREGIDNQREKILELDRSEE